MAAPNTNTSDLDHANATITELVSHLNNFKEACKTPSDDPDIFKRLQQLRINTIHGDLAEIREDLNSVRTRLESAAESAAASNEEDAAKRKEKQANLDRIIHAAEEREREAKKSEECLSAAIKFANDRAKEAQEAKAKAREKKAGAEEKHKAAEKMMQYANAKQDLEDKTTRDSNKIIHLEANDAGQKRKLVELEDQAVQDRNKIARLETSLAEEKKELEKAMLQQQEMNGQYSLLARLDITKTSTISSRPDLETIIRRAVGLTQSTSDVEAASILDSTNTDLPEGTQLIADVFPNVFFMITATGKVDIFDKADIRRVEYDCSLRMRLIMDGKSLLICDTPKDVEKSGICESWMERSGVALTLVVVVSM